MGVDNSNYQSVIASDKSPNFYLPNVPITSNLPYLNNQPDLLNIGANFKTPSVSINNAYDSYVNGKNNYVFGASN